MGGRGSGGDRNKKRKDSEKLKALIQHMRPYRGSDTEVETNLLYDPNFTKEVEERLEELSEKNKLNDPLVVEAYTDTLYTKQPWLTRNKLLNFADHMDTENTVLEGVRYKGKVLLIDGNHRAVIAKLASQEKVQVEVVDLDNPRKWWQRRKP